MNRRSFLKWLIVLISMISGMLWALVKLLQKAAIEHPGQSYQAQPGATEQGVPENQSKESVTTEALLSFFILTDPHISGDLPKHTERMKRALQDIQSFENKAQALVITGDLTDFGRDSDYQLLRQILKGYKLPPLFANMGNHDYYNIWLNGFGQFSRETMPNGKTDAQARERFQKFMGYDKPYHDEWVNGVHLITLSQEAYVQEKAEVGEGAWHSDAQLNWLKDVMAAHKDGKPAFVMIHQPLPPAGEDGGSHRLIRAKAFRDILKPYPNVFVFSGHHHREFARDHYVKETFHWFNNSSVTRVRSTKKPDNDFSQGIYVQVYEHEVVLRAREFSNRTWIDDAQWTVPLANTNKA